MNQTIEQLRAQGFKDLQRENYGDLGDYDKEGLFHAGAAWECKRSKWHDVADGLPTLKGWYLIRLCVSCDPQLLFYDADKLHYAWSEVISWAEIPR